MARKKEEKNDAVSFWLLASLVVAATVGAMIWMSRNDDDARRTTEQANEADQEVLEVLPLIPKGKIASASWHKKNGAVEEEDIEDTGKSMLDDMEDMDVFNDSERKNKAAESLRKTIDRIHGLGVYVAPANAEDDDK
jgi:hypothetical protein